MSTRGCIAVKQGEGWVGVYNHFDSYPTELGQKVWAELHKSKDIKATADKMLRLGDFRNYEADGVCEYCGRSGLGQPHDITGVCFDKVKDKPVDPDCKDHAHSPQGLIKYNKKMEKEEALWLEWVYVIDVEHAILKVFTSARDKGQHKVQSPRGAYKSSNYHWVLVTNLSVKGEEPNWKEVEDKGCKLNAIAYEKNKDNQS